MVQQTLASLLDLDQSQSEVVMGGAGKATRRRGGARTPRFWAYPSALWSLLATLKTRKKLSRFLSPGT